MEIVNGGERKRKSLGKRGRVQVGKMQIPWVVNRESILRAHHFPVLVRHAITILNTPRKAASMNDGSHNLKQRWQWQEERVCCGCNSWGKIARVNNKDIWSGHGRSL